MGVLRSLQYGITLGDPLSWTVVLAVLMITTAAASWRPARRATLLNPVLLLKED